MSKKGKKKQDFRKGNPQKESPRPEPSKQAAPKQEAPDQAIPKQEPPEPEAPTQQVPEPEPPEQEVRSREDPGQEIPKQELRKPEIQVSLKKEEPAKKDDFIIDLQDVHKAFGTRKVHRGVTLAIKRGENISILGGSGSGKSVLLKEITGLIKPDKGKVIIEGEDVAAIDDEEQLVHIRKKIGMLFQGSALFDSLSVAENIAYPLREHFKYPEEEINNIVANNLELVGLPGIEEKYPSDLSGGMKKRVGLARAMAMNPKILLYDEPTTGLDPPNISRINHLIRDMQKKFGITGIIITHDIAASAFHVSDRVAFLHQGRIIFVGTVEEAQSTHIEILDDFIHGRLEDDD